MGRLKTQPPRLQSLRPQVRTQGAAAERTRGRPWQRIRDRILTRDFGLCQTCRRGGWLTAASEVDHVKPLHLGGTDDDANLEAICSTCHVAKTAAEAGKRAAGG